MSENRFAEAEDIPQLIHQLVGAASTCWVGGTGDKEFWTAEARKVAGEAITRLNELWCGCVPVFPKASQVPDNLRDRIAAILHAHTLAENDPVFWRCCCTAYSDSFKDDYIAHDAHVADAVIAELGIREVAHCDECDHRRIISEWSD